MQRDRLSLFAALFGTFAISAGASRDPDPCPYFGKKCSETPKGSCGWDDPDPGVRAACKHESAVCGTSIPNPEEHICQLGPPLARSAAPASPPTTRLFNATDLLRARDALHAGSDAVLTASHATLLKRAKKALTATAQSVTNKTISLPGVSPHNYVSIGIYNHPCNSLPEGCKPYPGGKPLPPSKCDNASGLPWTPCDGIRNHDAINEGDSPSQSAMASAVESLALAAFYEQDAASTRAFVSKAASLLRTWFLDEDTAMLPNLYYGQIMPSKSPPKKGHGGFIEWTNTASLLDHVELMRFADPHGETWTENDHSALHTWFANFNLYIGSAEAQGERRMTNNHGTFYDVTWQAVALFAGNETSAGQAAQEVDLNRIATQILPNGTEWIEVQRNDGAHYAEYNLQAMAMNADLASSASAVDVWGFETADGRSLRKSLDWILLYAVGGAAWPYSEITDPNWPSLWEPLRRAAAAYGERSYEEAACQILASAGKTNYGSDIMNLLIPPRYAVSCSDRLMV